MSAPDRTRAPGPGPAPAFAPPPLERLALGAAGDVPCAVVPSPDLGVCVLQVGVGAGGRHAPADEAGRAALTADVLAEGTARLDGTALVAELDRLGATLDVRANDDELVLELCVLARHAERGAALLEDLVFAPRFAGADFERARRQRLARLEARRADSAALAADAWRAALFGADEPLGAPPAGTPESLARLTAEGLRACWDAAVAAAPVRVAAVGPFGGDRVRALLPRLAGLAARGGAGASDPPAATAPRRVVVDRPGAPQVQLRVGHRAVPAGHADFFPLAVLNHPLGGGMTGRLNRNLRERRGWTYGARSAFLGGLTTGWFQVAAAVEASVAAEAAREIEREVAALHAEGVTPEEVEHARAALGRLLLLQYEPAGARAAFAANVGKYGWPADYPARRLAWLERMGRADLDALAARHLRPDELTVVAVGDAARLDALEASAGA